MTNQRYLDLVNARWSFTYSYICGNEADTDDVPST